jgi:hypothetical protein
VGLIYIVRYDTLSRFKLLLSLNFCAMFDHSSYLKY